MLSPTMQAAGWKEALEGFVTQRAWHCRSCHQCEIRKGLDKLTVGIRAGGVVRCSARSLGEQIAQLGGAAPTKALSARRLGQP